MEDWPGIASEISAALASVGFVATITRAAAETGTGAGTPWGDAANGTPAAPQTFTVLAMNTGIKTRYSRDPAGALIPRKVRTLIASASGAAPAMGDKITVAGVTHDVVMVDTLAPSGEALLFKMELAI